MPTVSTRDEQFHERQHELLTAHSKGARRRDLAMFVISAVVLAATMAMAFFVEDIASAVAVPLLFVTWGLFALAIVFALVSFQIVQSSVYWRIRSAREFYVRDREDGGRSARVVAIVNDVFGWVTSLVFVAATVCLIVFVAINSSRMTEERQGSTNQSGNVSHAAFVSDDVSDEITGQ